MREAVKEAEGFKIFKLKDRSNIAGQAPHTAVHVELMLWNEESDFKILPSIILVISSDDVFLKLTEPFPHFALETTVLYKY